MMVKLNFQDLFEIDIFYNIINVFTIFFYQFNAWYTYIYKPIWASLLRSLALILVFDICVYY